MEPSVSSFKCKPPSVAWGECGVSPDWDRLVFSRPGPISGGVINEFAITFASGTEEPKSGGRSPAVVLLGDSIRWSALCVPFRSAVLPAIKYDFRSAPVRKELGRYLWPADHFTNFPPLRGCDGPLFHRKPLRCPVSHSRSSDEGMEEYRTALYTFAACDTTHPVGWTQGRTDGYTRGSQDLYTFEELPGCDRGVGLREGRPAEGWKGWLGFDRGSGYNKGLTESA